jgi:5-methyltetrahydropteroyltriglutamate--homocysteine methyltransferase
MMAARAAKPPAGERDPREDHQLQQPPFRAEHIGSLLRPAGLLELRRKHRFGQVSEAALRQAEDEAIGEAVALQERVGLRFVTDGEFRRHSYHSFFFSQLGDIEPAWVPADQQGTAMVPRRGVQPQARIRSRLQWTKPIHVEDFKFLQSRTKLTPKITIPGPCALHFRGGDQAVLASAYTDTDSFWADTVDAFVKELKALADAGCTYVQIDETAFAKFGDPHVQAELAARGDDWSVLIDRYIEVTNQVLRAAPASMGIGMHLCRGNRAGQFHSEGSYDSVADRLFNALEIPFYYLEYDSERAGGFEPLRFVPKDKKVVLGLVSTKSGALEDKDMLKRRVADATAFVDQDRLAISPQCGFASIEEGNPISPQEQEAKLRLVVETAREIWKDA